MNAKGFPDLKQTTKASLDEDTTKEMLKCLHNLTTSGNMTLDETELKKFKKFCRKSDDYVRYAFILIMEQLEKKHSEIRLSAFQVAVEIFARSHAFREILVTYLQDFLTLTTGTETGKPLPPPKSAANKLKDSTIRTVQQWYDNYGKSYRKLDVGYNYLKNCKHVDFQNIVAQNEAERLRIKQAERKKEKQRIDRLAKVANVIAENKPEIEDCVREAENCLKLLLPTPENFQLFTPEDATQLSTSDAYSDQTKLDNDHEDKDISDDKDEDEYSSDDFEDDDRAHGFGAQGVTINLEIPVNDISVKETDDNTDVLQSLKDAVKLINSSFLPRVTKWLEVLGKSGGSQSDIKSIIDLKVSLESVKAKCTEMRLVSMEKLGDQDSDDDDDDDDLEDVPEKEGYEDTVPTDLGPHTGCSTSKVPVEKPAVKRRYSTEASTSCSDNTNVSVKKSKSFGPHWHLKERDTAESLADPTSRATALARIRASTTSDKSKPSTSSSQSSTSKSSNPSQSQSVPFVEFGKDLAFWENPDKIEAPEIIKLDSLHRFWASGEKETEKASQHDIGLVLNRTFKFTGEFEPVKWSCRAPLKDGKLCPRMDRVKCPFHGQIVPRDESGNPAVKSEPSTSSTSTTSQADAEVEHELQPWRDPELQRQIEQATGHDLSSAFSQKLLDKAKNKGKGKGKRGKKSGLTDIKAASNTSRKRLEKRVFDKRSMRRVCDNLDRADYKRVRDKFGNQFSYSLR